MDAHLVDEGYARLPRSQASEALPEEEEEDKDDRAHEDAPTARNILPN